MIGITGSGKIAQGAAPAEGRPGVNFDAESGEPVIFEQFSLNFEQKVQPRIPGIFIRISSGIWGTSRPGSLAVIAFKLSAESGARAA